MSLFLRPLLSLSNPALQCDVNYSGDSGDRGDRGDCNVIDFVRCSVKFIALFSVVFIGVSVASDLWRIVGNKEYNLVSLPFSFVESGIIFGVIFSWT